MAHIVRDISCEIYGDFVLKNNKSGHSIEYFHRQTVVKDYNIIDYAHHIGRNVKHFILIESDASFSRCSDALRHAIETEKSTLIIILFTLIFVSILCKLKKEPVFDVTDGDLEGFGIHYRIKFGTGNTYRYLNEKLAIPYLIRIGIHAFEALQPYVVAFTRIEGEKIEAYQNRIIKLTTRNSFEKCDSFDYNGELCSSLSSSLIYGRELPGSSVSSTRTITAINQISQRFTRAQLLLTLSAGLPYFEFQDELATFWEEKCPPLEHEHALKFSRYGVPTVYVDRFVRIFNANQTEFVLKKVIFNSRLNLQFVCANNDRQILQTSVQDYILVDYNLNVVNIYGLATNAEFRHFQLESVVRHRYQNPREIHYVRINDRCASSLSGLICCRLCLSIDHFNEVAAMTSNDLITWFQSYIN